MVADALSGSTTPNQANVGAMAAASRRQQYARTKREARRARREEERRKRMPTAEARPAVPQAAPAQADQPAISPEVLALFR